MTQTVIAIAVCTLIVAAGAGADEAQRAQIAVEAAARGADRTWEALQAGADDLESRNLFHAALAYCEAERDLDRLAPLLQAASAMQDRDPASPGYGNFLWKRSETEVRDYNAVEFGMRSATAIWIRHQERLCAEARAELEQLLDHATAACLRHRVAPAYTNITLMNASNLILLGEALERPDVTAEGRERLDTFCVYTWEAGIHEFASPVYYGVNIEALLLLHELAESAEVREQADALLELLWTDVALNWWPPAQRLAGAHSRSNDYLRGRGGVEGHLWMAGWFDEPRQSRLAPAIASWRPPAELERLSSGRLPRLVRQSWGIGRDETRTHYLLDEITLSTAGAHFGPDDVPMTVDFATGRDGVRGYVISDARQDPYGTEDLPLGPHAKAFHSRPLWAAAQRNADALGLALYREGDLIGDPRALATHFVMPRDVDAAWIGGAPVAVDADEPFAHELPAGETLAIQKESVVMALRVPWARGFDGEAAPAALVFDGNPHGAMRLTIDHTAGATDPRAMPAAALWVRVGSGVDDLPRWLAEFAGASVEVEVAGDGISIEAAGADGPVALAVRAPWQAAERIIPEPCRTPLELDGAQIGRPILERIPAVARYVQSRQLEPEVATIASDGATVDAATGLVLPPARVQAHDDDPRAMVVHSPDAGGSVILRTTVERAGLYRIEGHLALHQEGPLTLRLLTESSDPAPEVTRIMPQAALSWQPLSDEAIMLPRGRIGLQLILPPGASIAAVRVHGVME